MIKIQFLSFNIFKFFGVKSLCFTLSFFLTCDISIAQWSYQGTVTGLGQYASISVYGPNELVVAGGTSGLPKVLKSTNGGINWQDISGNLIGPELFCIWAVNGNLIFAGDGGSNGGNGGDAKVWKTTNGGVNWTVIFSTGGTHGFFNGIVFSRTNPLIGIAESDPPLAFGGVHYLSKTTDGGNTWIVQNTISTNGNGVGNTIVCIDDQFYGWGLYPPARVIITSNSGNNWLQRYISSSDYTSGFAFSSDKTTGVAISQGSMPFISRSSDGGNTWIDINTGLPITSLEWGKLKWVYGTNTVFLSAETGASGCIGKSTNGGLNWSVMSTAGVTNLFNLDLIYSGGMIYAYTIARDGKIIRLQESPIGIKQVNIETPKQILLHQNYPNPFNPSTTIKFDIKNISFTKLIIYNITGREIATLVNEQLKPGTYEVELDCAKLPSGVYYYTLIANGFTDTKKMILIK